MLAASCGSVDEPVNGPIAVASAWIERTGEDPFLSHRPVEVRCPRAGWQIEGESLEVNTGECNYLLVEQPLLQDVPQGATIVVNLWHQVLHAPTAATGHAALAVDGQVLWERSVPIPNSGAVWRDETSASRPLRAGTPIVFHLHNHGANSWNLGEISIASHTQ
ncbi:MAG: hypothetical protein AAF449_10705 [Myxococcota bacterium]